VCRALCGRMANRCRSTLACGNVRHADAVHRRRATVRLRLSALSTGTLLWWPILLSSKFGVCAFGRAVCSITNRIGGIGTSAGGTCLSAAGKFTLTHR